MDARKRDEWTQPAGLGARGGRGGLGGCLPVTAPLDAAVAAELFYEIVHSPTYALAYMNSPLCMAIGVLYHSPAPLQLPIPPMHISPRAQPLPAGFDWSRCPAYAPWLEPADEEEATKQTHNPPVHPGARLWKVEHNEYPYLHLPWHWEDGPRAVGRAFRAQFAAGAARALETYCHEIHLWIGIEHPWKIVVRRDLPARIEIALPGTLPAHTAATRTTNTHAHTA
jgi:hypothetical protein